MIKLGYHISHEQFAPSKLLQYVQKAEEAGFHFALSSDHFYTWSKDQATAVLPGPGLVLPYRPPKR